MSEENKETEPLKEEAEAVSSAEQPAPEGNASAPKEEDIVAADAAKPRDSRKITVRALLLGTAFSALFAFLTVYCENFTGGHGVNLTATQISVMPYVLLFVTVLLLNPLCRLIRIVKAFSTAEILTIFIMGAVSGGISTFGMVSQTIPLVGSLYNQHWNNQQAKWDMHVEPFVNEAYFVGAPGLQDAAIDYRRARLELQELKKIFGRAENLLATEKTIKESKREHAETLKNVHAPAERIARLNRINETMRFAEKAREQAQRAWEPYLEVYSLEQVMAEYPSRIAEAEKVHAGFDEKLRGLEAEAFARVRVFRRGLPAEMRAYPGFIKLPSENLTTYAARFSRLMKGLSALKAVREARELSAAGRPWAEVKGEVASELSAAIATLTKISDTERDTDLKEQLTVEVEEFDAEWLRITGKLKKRQADRRIAPAEQFDDLDDEIEELASDQKTQDRERAELRKEIEQVDKRLAVTERVIGIMNDLTLLQQGESLTAETAEASMQEGDQIVPIPVLDDPERMIAGLDNVIGRFRAIDASMQRFLIGDIPWSVWLRPLFRWGFLIVLTYVILMTFNILIFRQWAHNEKLSYPLAKLPEMLAGAGVELGDTGMARRAIPPLFRTGLFWAGFGIVSVVHGWNLICFTGLVPGLPAIKLVFSWTAYVRGSVFEGIIGAGNIDIFFTMLGLAFFIPANISRSLWLFFVLFMGQLLVMVWFGFGVNAGSFQGNWWEQLNFRYAEGGGALLVFAVVALWKCRQYLLCGFKPSPINDLEPGERKELRASSIIFVCASVLLILILWLDLGANPLFAAFIFLVIMVITIGLVRAVAEGGILGFQCFFGPFHFVRAFQGLGDWVKSMNLGSVFGPLMTYYSILFLDIKAFIAPAMANCIKIRDDLRMSRMRFHLAMLCGIGIAMITSILVYLLMAYDRGADAMNSWFCSQSPRGILGKIVWMNTSTPDAVYKGMGWVIFGGVIMALLIFGRRFWFWLPHPIGLIMLVNPLMGAYWFSIFLGWLAKSLITKYGNKDTYRKTLFFFVGVIISQLLWVALYFLVSYFRGGGGLGLTLNRVAYFP